MWWARGHDTKASGVSRDVYQCANDVSPLQVSHNRLAGHPVARSQLTVRCQQCGGKGRRIARACPRCKGSKVLDTQHTLAVHIPAGAPEGFEEVFQGEADESTEWEAGDVVVRVRSQKKDQGGGWGRKENGIVGRVTLSVAEVCPVANDGWRMTN